MRGVGGKEEHTPGARAKRVHDIAQNAKKQRKMFSFDDATTILGKVLHVTPNLFSPYWRDIIFLKKRKKMEKMWTFTDGRAIFGKRLHVTQNLFSPYYCDFFFLKKHKKMEKMWTFTDGRAIFG